MGPMEKLESVEALFALDAHDDPAHAAFYAYARAMVIAASVVFTARLIAAQTAIVMQGWTQPDGFGRPA